jgi:hypothetical protein
MQTSQRQYVKQTQTIPETFLGVGYTRDRAGLPLEAVRSCSAAGGRRGADPRSRLVTTNLTTQDQIPKRNITSR